VVGAIGIGTGTGRETVTACRRRGGAAEIPRPIGEAGGETGDAAGGGTEIHARARHHRGGGAISPSLFLFV
jgi:hypothetical protein